jgi:very-short-patch-repair endonuclease
MTAIERLVWSRLYQRQFDGYKFRRQAPIGPYVADFYCPATRLIVEIDGPGHDFRISVDQCRTRYLEGKGFRVIRFTADEALQQLDDALETIWRECLAAPPHPTLPAKRGGVSF